MSEQLDLTTLNKHELGMMPVILAQIWRIVLSERPMTRQQRSFMPLTFPWARLDLRKYSFSVRSAKLWNGIP